ncbi:MAG: proline--tRNA ligase [Gemmataceae bacterium]
MADQITPREKDYSQWYQDVIRHAGLAETSEVRGCIIIKPHGYAIWEKMQKALDKKFKDTGHVNAYFPLFIPKRFLEKEAEHVEGFAKECAVVTHTRLVAGSEKGTLVPDPASKLEEEYIIRPTSETVIWNTYRDWIQSYRDLPILLNQWANVVRMEMRTRVFLRTSEFLWQEGHTAHATEKEAIDEAHQMLEVYRSFVEDWMSMPVLTGAKTEGEKFPGAVETLCIEAMMQDKRALQAGTSHFLGQNFAKAFEVQFQDESGKREYPWATSWGVSTRLVGGLIMTHSDDIGLVLPPRLAPVHVVIVPIFKKDDEKEQVMKTARGLEKALNAMPPDEWFNYDRIAVKLDDREQFQPGHKFFEWEAKGVPIRIEIGPKDVAKNACVIARRDIPGKPGKEFGVALDSAPARIMEVLKEIQSNLFEKAKTFREENTHEVDSYDEFKERLEGEGGFFLAHWDGTGETEKRIAEETKATIRCIPFHQKEEEGKCILTGQPSKGRVIFARSY